VCYRRGGGRGREAQPLQSGVLIKTSERTSEVSSEETYCVDTISVEMRTYSNGTTSMTLYGKCHDITEAWRHVLCYVSDDARECAQADAFRIVRGWHEFGPLGAAMELPVRS
jgi:hypothetical protein